jgi:hypothetical protein
MKANAVLIMAVAVIIAVSVVSATAQPFTCVYAPPDEPNAGIYNERRVFLESQGWWMDPGEPFPGRHVHVSTCFPWAGLSPQPVLTGTVTFHVRVQLHAQPAGHVLTGLRSQIADDAGQHLASALQPDVSCNNTDCTYWFIVNFDTTVGTYDGIQELRFLTEVDQGTTEQFATTGWQAKLENNKPDNDYRATLYYTEARGWYTGHGYANARLKSTIPLPSSPVPTNFVTSWSLAKGSGGLTITKSECAIDPDYHAGNNGTIVLSTNSQYVGDVTVDTSALAPGTHRLVCRAEANSATSSPPGNNVGVQVIRFTK